MWHEEDPGDEPDWVEEERRQFRDFRDKDNNGFLGWFLHKPQKKIKIENFRKR